MRMLNHKIFCKQFQFVVKIVDWFYIRTMYYILIHAGIVRAGVVDLAKQVEVHKSKPQFYNLWHGW